MSLLIISIEGQELSDADCMRLSSPLVAGVILFTRNYKDHQQLQELTRAIKSCAPHLFICVDHEGGRIQRFREGYSELPPAKTWESRYQENAEQALAAMAESARTMLAEIRADGLDMSLVPCLDIDWGNSEIIGDRSFSSDPASVTFLAQVYVRTLKTQGMPVTGKHFPGHGYASLDSHLAMPIDERDWETIKASDALPYRAMINELDLIMPAHITYPKVDELPVTFSKTWLQEILRGELGYGGIIVSDCLTMVGAAKLYHDIVERVNKATQAGCDLVFLCNSDALVDELMARQQELLEQPEESRNRVQKLLSAFELNPV